MQPLYPKYIPLKIRINLLHYTPKTGHHLTLNGKHHFRGHCQGCAVLKTLPPPDPSDRQVSPPRNFADMNLTTTSSRVKERGDFCTFHLLVENNRKNVCSPIPWFLRLTPFCTRKSWSTMVPVRTALSLRKGSSTMLFIYSAHKRIT